MDAENLNNAKQTAARLNATYTEQGLTAFVFRTFRIQKKAWVPTGRYGVRCYKANEKVETMIDGDYAMVPFPC